jgi:hypothetical protein
VALKRQYSGQPNNIKEQPASPATVQRGVPHSLRGVPRSLRGEIVIQEELITHS